MSKNLAEAKLLSSSIARALDILYNFNVMHSDNSLEDIDKTNGTLFTIQAAAEMLSEIMEGLE